MSRLDIEYKTVNLQQRRSADLIMVACWRAAKDLGLETGVEDQNSSQIIFDDGQAVTAQRYRGSKIKVRIHGIPYCEI